MAYPMTFVLMVIALLALTCPVASGDQDLQQNVVEVADREHFRQSQHETNLDTVAQGFYANTEGTTHDATPGSGNYNQDYPVNPDLSPAKKDPESVPLTNAGGSGHTTGDPRSRAKTDPTNNGGTNTAVGDRPETTPLANPNSNLGPGGDVAVNDTLARGPAGRPSADESPLVNGKDLGPGGGLTDNTGANVNALGSGGALTDDTGANDNALGPAGRLDDSAPVGSAAASSSGDRVGTLSALGGIIGDLVSHAEVLTQLTGGEKLQRNTQEWKTKSKEVWQKTVGVHGQAQVLLSKMLAAHIVLSMQAKGMHVERTSIGGGLLSQPSEKIKLLSTMYKIYPMHLRRLKDHYDHPADKHKMVNDAAAKVVADNGGYKGDPRNGNELPNED